MFKEFDLADALLFVGASCVVAGVALIYYPAAFIVAGVALAALAIIGGR